MMKTGWILIAASPLKGVSPPFASGSRIECRGNSSHLPPSRAVYYPTSVAAVAGTLDMDPLRAQSSGKADGMGQDQMTVQVLRAGCTGADRQKCRAYPRPWSADYHFQNGRSGFSRVDNQDRQRLSSSDLPFGFFTQSFGISPLNASNWSGRCARAPSIFMRRIFSARVADSAKQEVPCVLAAYCYRRACTVIKFANPIVHSATASGLIHRHSGRRCNWSDRGRRSSRPGAIASYCSRIRPS